MSSISSIGQDLSVFFQNLAAGLQSSTASASSAANATGTSATAATASQQMLGGHHHGGMFKKIEQAVTEALQSAQSSGSTADPNQIIKSTIAKLLQNMNGTSSASATTAATNGAANSSGTTNSGTTNSADSAQQAFFQTLQSYGVNPQQFSQDFFSAIQTAQGTQGIPSSAFQNFIGTFLDAIA